MGMFITIAIDEESCEASEGCDICTRVCPVDALQIVEGRLRAIHENEDECTLCYLCTEECPKGALEIRKLY